MRVLFVGAGHGSWTMRGLQLGAALGARMTSEPRQADWAWAELAVLVKRHGARHAAAAKAAGCPVVWDALDCWRQPWDNGLTEAPARALLANQISALGAARVIGATEAQAAAAGGVYLPHHSWQGLEPAAVREDIQSVAYQGNVGFLGRWRDLVAKACQARGWRFLVNPSDLREADILVALREGPWDGWMCRQWKSGVKLVNAVAAGRPVITQATAAFSEIKPPGSIVENDMELLAAFDAWTPVASRAAALEQCRALAPAYHLSSVADRYRRLLETVASEACTPTR